MGKKIALATLAGFLTLSLLGYVTYELLLKNAMADYAAAFGACMSATPDMTYGFIGIFLQALILTLVLHKFHANTFQAGLIHGAWFTALIVLWYDMWFLASMPPFTPSMIAMDLIPNTILAALAGGVIAWVLGRIK
jgi:hypothetical protein